MCVHSLSSLLPADLALRGGRLAFRHTGEVPCILHSNGQKELLAFLEPHLSRAAPLWSLTALTAQRARRDYARERRALDHGAWATLKLPVLPPAEDGRRRPRPTAIW